MSVLLQHSNFGASGAHRWVTCPASIQAIQAFRKDNNVDGENLAADEGTLAHELSEYLQNNPEAPPEDADTDWVIDVVSVNPVWKDRYSDEFDFEDMLSVAIRYRDYATQLEESFDPNDHIVRLTETMVHMPRIHEKSFGTNDYAVVNLSRRTASILDLKYGRSVRVEVEGNYQVLQYAEGIRDLVKREYGVDIEYFEGHIFQPRHSEGENIASWNFTKREVTEFVMIAADAAALAESDNPPFNPSEKGCHFCDAKGTCSALTNQMAEVVSSQFEDYDMNIDEAIEEHAANVTTLSDEDLALWFGRSKAIIKWMESVKEVARSRAIDGREITGYKLVKGRAVHRGREPELEMLLGDDAYEKPKLRSMSSLKKHVGAKAFRERFEKYFDTIEGNPILAPQSSTSPEWKPAKLVQEQFEDLNTEDL